MKQAFTIRSRYIKQFNKLYQNVFESNKTMVVHIRRTDYLQHGKGMNFKEYDISLPLSYLSILNHIN